MGLPACSDEEFIRLFETSGASKTAIQLNIPVRNVFSRRSRVEKRIGRSLINPNTDGERSKRFVPFYESRIPFEIQDGQILIGSDAHFWPDEKTAAFRGFLALSKKVSPIATILNGDVFDGARISRHPPSGWNLLPTVKEELEAVKDRLHEIECVYPKSERFWIMGNHDLRFENKLAQQASEFEGVQGFSLKDQFPTWEMGMSLWINDQTVVKHRLRCGIHAAHNNTVNAGKTIITGHLHSLKVTPFDDYNGTRFGVDTGTLACPAGPQFSYLEDNPTNWRSGFIVLTFKNGMLMWPEVAHVVNENTIQFRGELFGV